MLDSSKKIELSKYMIAKSENDLETAKILLSLDKYEASINRSYYAIFSCMRAVLALDMVEFKKHSGVISYFSREYLKTNIFNKKHAKAIKDAFMYRTKSDYEYFYIAFKSDAENQYNSAKEFLEETKKYLTNRINDNSKF